jgi:hypothetical protein
MLTLDSNGSWIGNDLNKSQKAYFYWLLADLTVVNLAIHMLLASPVLTRTIHLQWLKGWLILIQVGLSQQVLVCLTASHH